MTATRDAIPGTRAPGSAPSPYPRAGTVVRSATPDPGTSTAATDRTHTQVGGRQHTSAATAFYGPTTPILCAVVALVLLGLDVAAGALLAARHGTSSAPVTAAWWTAAALLYAATGARLWPAITSPRTEGADSAR